MSAELMKVAHAIYECLKPCQVYLFGSYVKGTEQKDSDYDFYVVVDDNTRDTYQQASDAYGEAHKICSKPIDILVRHKSKFEQRKSWSSTVEYDVANEGVLLYE